MDILILVVAMIVTGPLISWLAGIIWKGQRPIGVKGDFFAALGTSIAVALLDWFVIPAMGFSSTMRNIGVAIEPALAALAVLWIIRLAKK